MNATLSTLHTVNKSAFSSDALASCLRVAQPGDAILLLEDGVYNALRSPVGASPAGELLGFSPSPAGQAHTRVRAYALQEDLQARGIAVEQLPAYIEPISYPDFVTLVCTYARTVSWF